MALRYATGCVGQYQPKYVADFASSLPGSVWAGRFFRSYYDVASWGCFSAWDNGDVWSSDFTMGPISTGTGGATCPRSTCSSATGSGADLPPLQRTRRDFADGLDSGQVSRWGNAAGHLHFMFVDACESMPLDYLGEYWFPVFRGLHMAVGNDDTIYDSSIRAAHFAALTGSGWRWTATRSPYIDS